MNYRLLHYASPAFSFAILPVAVAAKATNSPSPRLAQGEGQLGEDVIWASTRAGLTPVSRDLVEWVEAHGDYVLLHVPPKSYLVRSTMTAVQARFPRGEMLRAHRSALVRVSAIAAVRRPGRGRLALQLQSGAEVPVGRAHRAQVLAVLNLRPRSLPR